MMPAAKHLDPILGIDLHLVLIPGSPTPTPIPHPYIGVILDPFDYLPFIGSSVRINGLPRAQAGTGGLSLPFHFPIGGTFVKPPGNSSEAFMGSSTVIVENEPQSYLGLPALSCQDFGLPSPPRFKRKSAPKSLMLPLSIVLAIPLKLVAIGGSPTISLMGLACTAALAGLGKAFKKARKARKASRRLKALSDRLHNRVDNFCKKLGLGDSARNRVHRAVCTVTGHPVDVATGKLFTSHVDFALPGPIPFRWERVWYSTSTYRGELGHGWHHRYDLALYVEPDALIARLDDGRYVAFPRLEEGQEWFDRREQLTLMRSLTHYALRLNSGTCYHFAPSGTVHRLQRIDNAHGDYLELGYDASGRLARIRDSAARQLTLEHDREGRIVGLCAPHPDAPARSIRVASYGYDAAGNLTRATDARGLHRLYRYEDQLLVQETDRANFSYYFRYAGAGAAARCIATWADGDIHARKLEYDTELEQTRVINSLGARTLYQCERGIVVRAVDALGASSSARYNAAGEILEQTDELGQKTRSEYDERGRPTLLELPDGARYAFAYDAQGRMTRMLDAAGAEWRWTYSRTGKIRDVAGWQTASFEERSHLSSARDGQQQISLDYDDQHNVSAIAAAGVRQVRWRHDGWGRPIEMIDHLGNAQRIAFDLDHRILRVDEPDGNIREFSYDAEGRLLRFQDAHNVVQLGYDAAGSITSWEHGGASVSYEYDTEQRLIAVLNEHGQRCSFELNPLGAVVAETRFDGRRRSYERDALGRIGCLRDEAGGITRYAHDAAGRILAIEHPDGSQDKFSYRSDGQLIKASNASGTLEFERDLLGRVTAERWGRDWVRSSYDESGRAEISSSRGLRQRLTRDALGELATLDVAWNGSAWRTTFERDWYGRELERRLPGRVALRTERCPLGTPRVQQLTAAGTALHAQRYEWDVDLRLRAKVDTLRGITRYDYDRSGGLIAARARDAEPEWRVRDALGNLYRAEQERDRRYGPAGNLLRAGSTDYVYDALGRLIEKQDPAGAFRYRWNANGTLAEVVRPDGASIQFAYDPLGRRIEKRCADRTTHYRWDGDLLLHEWQDDAADAKTWLFAPGTHLPLARLSADAWHSIATDMAGAPFAMLGEHEGQPLWSGEVGIYGDLRAQEGERDACPFRWLGQYADPETGLSYNRHRYYDPAIGHFLSPDPLGFAAGLRLYAYPKNPLAASDPLGLRIHRIVDPVVENANVPHLQSHLIELAEGNRPVGLGRNLAAFWVRGHDEPLVYQSAGGPRHSEVVGLEKLEKLIYDERLRSRDVLGVYSELDFCTGRGFPGCFDRVNAFLPGGAFMHFGLVYPAGGTGEAARTTRGISARANRSLHNRWLRDADFRPTRGGLWVPRAGGECH